MRSFICSKWLAGAARFARNLGVVRLQLGAVTLIVLAFSGVFLSTPGGLSGMAAWAAASDVRLEAEKPKKRLVIGIDLSQSNPLVSDAKFARKVADRVAGMVSQLGFTSEIRVRTFGSYVTSANTFHYDAVLSIRNRPDAVAAEVARLISGTPTLIDRGVWQAQPTTNIIAFLDNASVSFGCTGLPTVIVLLSDGIEDSEYARLAHLDSSLPTPEGAPFKGCAELQILGLGQGQPSPETTKRLRREWNGWAQAAGFQSFLGLNDW
ncbi:MAG: hypothetical protein ACT4OG_09245 [Alphaproteobacteria bacterium]